MRSALLCLSLAALCRAQSPTALERFAGLSGSSVTWSKDIGRMDSSDTHLVVTAMVLENASQTPNRMLGVRIELSNADDKERVYLDGEGLGKTQKGFQEIEDTLDRFLKQPRRAGMSCWGSGIFWQSDPRILPLTGSYCTRGDDAGLYVSAHGRFVFPYQRPAPL